LGGDGIEILTGGGAETLTGGTSSAVGVLGDKGDGRGLDGVLSGKSVIETKCAANGFTGKCGDGGE